jgi:CRISPR-associated protein Cas2
MDAALCCTVKHKLQKIIDPAKDSLRFYYLGNNYKSKIEHFGAKPSFDIQEPLIV